MSDKKLVFVMGQGRSGTTWLGDLLNLNQNVYLKFEPFLSNPHRRNEIYLHWLSQLDEATGGDAGMLQQFLKVCSTPCLGVDEPSATAKGSKIASALLGASKKVASAAPLFEKNYLALYKRFYAKADTLVLKDVNFPNEKLPALMAVLKPKLITIVRHPAPVYLSAKKMMKNDFLPKSLFPRLKFLIEYFKLEHLKKYSDHLSDLSEIELSVVAWRVHNEPLVQITSQYQCSYVTTHEQLIQDFDTKMSEIWSALEWEMPDGFLESFKPGNKNTHLAPQTSIADWRHSLSEEQSMRLEGIFSESPLRSLWTP